AGNGGATAASADKAINTAATIASHSSGQPDRNNTAAPPAATTPPVLNMACNCDMIGRRRTRSSATALLLIATSKPALAKPITTAVSTSDTVPVSTNVATTATAAITPAPRVKC